MAAWLPSLLLLVPVTLLMAGTVYQVLFALQVITLGDGPGEEPAGYHLALAAGLLGMVLGAVFGPVLAFSVSRRILSVVLAPAAAAFVTARYFTFDSYYGDDMVRFSERGPISAEWIVGLIIAAIAATWASKYWHGTGVALTSGVLLLCGCTAVFQQTGH